MRAATWLFGLAACGRIGFEARSGGGIGDGNSGDGGFSLTNEAALVASNGEFGDNFGYDVAISGDGTTIAVAAMGEDSSSGGINGNGADNSASDAGAAYVLVRSGTTWTQQAYIKATTPIAADQLGRSLALSEDGNTLVVCAPQEDSVAPDSGAAYVFTRSGTTWTASATLKASNPGNGDFFGTAVAMSGDGSTIAVAAIGEESAATGINGNQADNSMPDSGAVYVFRNTGTWTQEAYVKATNTQGSDDFGQALALSRTGDTLAVSAVYEASAATGIDGNQADNSAANAGAVYVLNRTGSTWSHSAYIKPSNTRAGEWFGYAIALSASGDVLAVGALHESSAALGVDGDQASTAAPGSGAVYVFAHAASWQQAAYIKASNTDSNDNFGNGVALSSVGDVLLVGAPSEANGIGGIDAAQSDNSLSSAGAAYLFSATPAWQQRVYIKPAAPQASSYLGHRVSLSSDGRTAVAAAPGETMSGGVHVFE